MQKSIRHESKKIRDSARDQPCMVRLAGICNFNPSTTILAHIRINTGIGIKSSDLMASYCCSNCHDEIDRRTCKIKSLESVKLAHYEGVFRTQQILLDEGLVKIWNAQPALTDGSVG